MLRLTHSRDSQIRHAIAEKWLVTIDYNGRRRVAEPHDYGRQKGVDRLLVYQLRVDGEAGRSDKTGWRMLDVPKIESFSVLEEHFKGSRQQANQNHNAWEVLYARVG